MLLKDIQKLFYKELNVIYGKDEADSFFFMCVEFYCALDRLELALNPQLSITKDEQHYIFDALNQLKYQKPIQYILGETEFFGMKFKVDEHVLIPRPETEELVQWILDVYNKHEEDYEPTILDIGTGSGCIAIALANTLAKAKVNALDVSKEALKIANANAELNKVKVDFVQVDILGESLWDLEFGNLKFDTIVSNPPYVKYSEKEQMQPNVLENEPHLALFVEDDDALMYYKAIVRFSNRYLKSNGNLFFEINEQCGQEIIELMAKNGFSQVELRKDIFGKERIVKGIKI